MWDKTSHTFYVEEASWWPSGWILTAFDLQALSKTVQIHPSGNHATSYKQRGWAIMVWSLTKSDFSGKHSPINIVSKIMKSLDNDVAKKILIPCL